MYSLNHYAQRWLAETMRQFHKEPEPMQDMPTENASRLSTDCVFEVLDAMADWRLRTLTNYGDRWGIAHKTPEGAIAEIFDADLDRLIETWMKLRNEWDTE
jgi:hypothetical protein